MKRQFFIDRRTGAERRSGEDNRKNPRLDLPHKRRRRQADRRRHSSVADDFYALHGLDADDLKTPPQRH